MGISYLVDGSTFKMGKAGRSGKAHGRRCKKSQNLVFKQVKSEVHITALSEMLRRQEAMQPGHSSGEGRG